ncbi:N-acetylglucosamine 6-phosphate deacetylase [Arsukibacterium sp. MJ3]|uniref:N-acetylglucosamine-6-phosphate deacetylase n=1 Tax=Arsukibacterium sp. MJ3 TaxID=1632859 RepID=UPI0006270EA0|nr:N-acetylglucosamine-6-phosphate deacetylase [Arsukibacterium sp. MJ3]KKO49615.1 N-acetylglucosamine 6-phosphate deacetylase [Arsukibacterium sp. MJ3]
MNQSSVVTDTLQSIAVAKLFDGNSWHSNVELSWQNGMILTLKPANGPVQAGILVPGFIDLQVNGGGGMLFNTAPVLETLQTMTQAHCRFGTTAMLPTVITDALTIMQRAADVIAMALTKGLPGIIGIHFEGPHLAVPKKGVHPAEHIRPISAGELALYQRTDLGIKLITVAPENVTPAQIQQLVAAGMRVWLGHSDADAATVSMALAAGASGFTHLYNAMSPLTSREPGMVGVALTDNASWCGIILDGLHVHPTAAKLALAAKPKGKVLLVTDAMAPVGTNDTEFAFFSGRVVRDGNKLTNEAGVLAGSVLDMAGAVRYAIEVLAVEPAEALRMAALYPAQALGCADKLGKLGGGYQADMLLLNHAYQVQQSWIAGTQAYPLPPL